MTSDVTSVTGMQFVQTISELRDSVQQQRSRGRTVGLVPTMGNLHAGHLKLIDEARRKSDWVICSIFVNPLQFGPKEDLSAYPRTLEEDRVQLQEHQCHCLFHPDNDEIYPEGLQQQTVVSVPELGSGHCGKSRPGHFDGVATVVSKLFNLCQPDRAFFGLKDYQQYLIIRKMVRDLLFPVEIFGVETVREADGLAMSSRNNYLNEEQRQCAPALYQTLVDTRERVRAGMRDYRKLETEAVAQLQAAGLRPDYFTISHGETLRPATASDSSLAILAAAFLGRTRLIDNVRLSLDG